MGRLTAIVLGAAAGGGFPQWNCRCAVCRLAWDGDPRVSARTQASLAVSADGERWTLLNAAPDLRAQLAATPALHPRGRLRASPIEAVLLTGAEVDQTAGLLNLRERQPFTLAATARDARGARRQCDVRRAGARRRHPPRHRDRKAVRAARRADGRAVHRARQGAALSRTRHVRARGRERRQCRRRDHGGRRAALLRSRRRERDAGPARPPRARRRRAVRRHAVRR